MLPTRRERKKEKNRNDIIECAVSLFKEKGFAETTIDEILDKANISRGTLYNYFPDKESILVGYFQNKIARASQELSADMQTADQNIREQLDILIDFMQQIFTDDLDLAEIYFRYRLQSFGNPFESSQRSGMENLVTGIIQAGQTSGEIRSDLPAAMIARNFQFISTSFLIFGTQDNQSGREGLYKEQIIKLFLHGAGIK